MATLITTLTMITSSSGILYVIMPINYCYLERKKYNVLKFHVNDFSYFELRASPSLSFKSSPPINAAPQGFEIKYAPKAIIRENTVCAYHLSKMFRRYHTFNKIADIKECNIYKTWALAGMIF